MLHPQGCAAISDLIVPKPDFSNINSLWSSVVAETLVRSGVRIVVLSPGSRSTPLVFAFARHPGLECVPVLDERSAAFFALGIAKRSRTPVALLCTSGTAVANYMPAVIEAHESGVPLIVLSADRPPELRECHSGQTIDQQKIFGVFVRLHHELMVPGADLTLLRALRQSIAHAVAVSLGPEPGPVHLNCPFRDPLVPVPDASTKGLEDRLDEHFFESLRTAKPTVPSFGAEDGRVVEEWIHTATDHNACGIVIAGPDMPRGAESDALLAERIAGALGAPLLVDGVSDLRHRAVPGVVRVAHYDGILRSSKASETLRPHWVICVGGWPTSKALRSWLQRCDPSILFASSGSRNRDGLHGRTMIVPLASLGSWAMPASPATTESLWLQRWSWAERVASSTIDDAFAASSDLVEPKLAWLLGRELASGSLVFSASSMPIRDIEYFWPVSNRGYRFLHNRGANGIDGTLSTALGVAHGEEHAWLVTGDLAFLHDSNGLLLHPKLRGKLTVILVNNKGGGIFEHLPVAEFGATFEDYFAVPQNVDFGALCAAHGIEHIMVRDWDHLSALLGHAGTYTQGIRLLELRTDRKKDALLRKQLLHRVGDRVDEMRLA